MHLTKNSCYTEANPQWVGSFSADGSETGFSSVVDWPRNPRVKFACEDNKKKKKEEEEEEVGVLTTGYSRLVIQPVSYRHTGKAFFEHNTESQEDF